MTVSAAWILLMAGLAQSPEVAPAATPAPVEAATESVPASDREAGTGVESTPAAAQSGSAPGEAKPAPKVISRIEGLPRLGLPGVVLEGGDAELRALYNEQLAAELEGAGFLLWDANVLRQAGAQIPREGCIRAEPLCGAVDEIEQVLLGRMALDALGIRGSFELRDVKSGRALWRGQVFATDMGELATEFHRLAWEELPPVFAEGRAFVAGAALRGPDEQRVGLDAGHRRRGDDRGRRGDAGLGRAEVRPAGLRRKRGGSASTRVRCSAGRRRSPASGSSAGCCWVSGSGCWSAA